VQLPQLTYDFDDDVVGNDEASELFGTLGFTDTFVFTTAFTGNVAIDDIEVGGDLTDDNIDLSALGLTNGIDDLVATDIAAGVLITSDAFEGQHPVGWCRLVLKSMQTTSYSKQER
jgi:hypothetical protein